MSLPFYLDKILYTKQILLELFMEHLTEQLVEAVRNGCSEHIDDLIQQGADPLIRESWLLRLAAMNGDYTMVEKLLNYCDPTVQNSAVLRLAAEQGCVQCVSLLLPHCNPKELNSKALMMAAQNGHLEVVELLAPVSCVLGGDDTPYQQTALYAALVSGKSQILNCVLKHLTQEEKDIIDYDFWANEIFRGVDIKNHSESMAFFKMFDPQTHLTIETASEICTYEYHRLDAEAASIVLDRAYNNGFSFVTKRGKYSFLNLSAVLGKTDILQAFFERGTQSEYLIELLTDTLKLWHQNQKIPVESAAAGIECIALACKDALASKMGDGVLLAASATQSEDLFATILPYCNLERTYANAQGSYENLELLERYNSVRVNKLLTEHVQFNGGSQKRKM